MYKATLYFSDRNKDTRDAALARVIELGNDVGFAGATITRTLGIWNGNIEPGFTYSVLHPVRAILESSTEQVAAHMALEYEQESVLVELEAVSSARLVSANSESETL